jgi:hypothetical protein
MNILWFLVPLLVIAGTYALIYNGLIRLKNQVDNAFGSIEANLQKRLSHKNLFTISEAERANPNLGSLLEG